MLFVVECFYATTWVSLGYMISTKFVEIENSIVSNGRNKTIFSPNENENKNRKQGNNNPAQTFMILSKTHK